MLLNSRNLLLCLLKHKVTVNVLGWEGQIMCAWLGHGRGSVFPKIHFVVTEDFMLLVQDPV